MVLGKFIPFQSDGNAALIKPASAKALSANPTSGLTITRSPSKQVRYCHFYYEEQINRLPKPRKRLKQTYIQNGPVLQKNCVG